MKRLLIEELILWKNKQGRKPLILQGARQVGKTWLLKTFGAECFEEICYINFEQNNSVNHIFEGSINPERIIEQLSVFHGKRIQPEKTLIIFDTNESFVHCKIAIQMKRSGQCLTIFSIRWTF